MKSKTLFISLVLACVPAVSATAQTTSERIDNLERMIESLQDELVKARAEIAKIKSNGKGVVKTDGEDITVSTTGGGISVKSDNGNSFKLGGRIMMDYDFYDDVFSGGDGSSQSEGEFRRTRLTAAGSVKKDWKYKFTVNIDDQDESADVNTAYIDYAGFGPLTFRVGKFKEPFSLERLTSSKWISTIERNLTLDFLAGNLGSGQPDFGGVQVAGYHKDMSHFNWAVGVFDDGSEDEDGDDNYSITGRVTMTPHFGDNHFLHLGAAYSKRDIEGRVRYRSRLGVHTADDGRPTFADAYVDDVDQLGLEAAYVRGAFSLQGEYIDASADGDLHPDAEPIEGFDTDNSNQVDGACYYAGSDGTLDNGDTPVSCDDIDFDGYYMQAAYTLTGETRGYKTKGAYFDKIKPQGQWGAWELVARYEDVDVDNDNDDAIAGKSVSSDAEK